MNMNMHMYTNKNTFRISENRMDMGTDMGMGTYMSMDKDMDIC